VTVARIEAARNVATAAEPARTGAEVAVVVKDTVRDEATRIGAAAPVAAYIEAEARAAAAEVIEGAARAEAPVRKRERPRQRHPATQ